MPFCLYPLSKLAMRPNPPLLKYIMPTPKTPIPLPPKEEDRRGSKHAKAYTSKDIKHRLRALLRRPIINEVAEAIEEEILEHHAQDKDLIRHVAVRINGIGGCTDSGACDTK